MSLDSYKKPWYKKWKLLVPMILLFGSPWMHWAVYHNLLSAWPDIDHGLAHFVGISGSVLAFTVSCMFANE